ncbi:MAG: Cache 3/Cache 2 fusion domain-containing protein, partial [Treponema sp.]|nr:Cache 3/Cache 2 fusion domain-containing protein [Treponema sp.]
MKLSKFFHTLQFRLIAIVLAIFLASNVILITVALNLSTSSTEKTVSKLLDAVTDSAAGKIKGENEKHFRALSTIARADFLKDDSIPLLEKCRQCTRLSKVSEDYENFGLYDLDGNSYTAAGQKIQLQRAYIDAAKRGENYLADPAVNPVTHIFFQIYAVPVFDDDGKPIGCIAANVMGDVLSKRIEQINFGTSESSVQVVSRKTGNTIASTNFENVENSQNVTEDADENIAPILQKVMEGETGSDAFVNPADGMKMIAAYRPVPGTDWSVLGVCGYDDFYSDLTKMTSFFGILSIIMLIVAFCAVGATMSISLKPLKKVRVAIDDVASGDADLTKRINSKGKDEVSDV